MPELFNHEFLALPEATRRKVIQRIVSLNGLFKSEPTPRREKIGGRLVGRDEQRYAMREKSQSKRVRVIMDSELNQYFKELP